MRAWLQGACIFLAAVLLFLLEPMTAKRILPWFGGTAAVWTTCLVFYQVVLLAGYLYARFVAGRFGPRIHIALLAVSLALLPIGPGERWRPYAETAHPAAQIAFLLSAAIGLPFLLLSATSPLLQHWIAARGFSMPYAFFALSNAASLIALLAYPALVEPNMSTAVQSRLWSGLYAGFAIACGISAWNARSVRATWNARVGTNVWWIALPACGSMLLIAITNHMTQNVAPVPLLWVVPLAIYLLTFIFAFSPKTFYRRPLWTRVLAMALGSTGYAIYNIRAVQPLQIAIPVLLFGLFAGCLFCHGELNALRPEPAGLTQFYLCVALGGAIGAVLAGVAAPLAFDGLYELPVTLVVTAALAFAAIWRDGDAGMRLLWSAVTAGMIAVLAANVYGFHENSLVLERNFYGSLRVVQTPLITERQTRTLLHGTITHGEEFLWPTLRDRPTTYYGPDSGIGIVLRECYPSPRLVGIVGLGAGTLAAYGRPGDEFRFYEINPDVVNLAQGLFYFLRDSQARVSLSIGDARLALRREKSQRFNVLALDAFSGDAVPVHLLTREAMDLYTQRLLPDGTLAFHVSNEYLNLATLVQALARQAGYSSVLVRNESDEDAAVNVSDWVLVTCNQAVLSNASVRVHAVVSTTALIRPWTDEYNNLFELLKTPELKPGQWTR